MKKSTLFLAVIPLFISQNLLGQYFNFSMGIQSGGAMALLDDPRIEKSSVYVPISMYSAAGIGPVEIGMRYKVNALSPTYSLTDNVSTAGNGQVTLYESYQYGHFLGGMLRFSFPQIEEESISFVFAMDGGVWLGANKKLAYDDRSNVFYKIPSSQQTSWGLGTELGLAFPLGGIGQFNLVATGSYNQFYFADDFFPNSSSVTEEVSGIDIGVQLGFTFLIGAMY